MELRQLNKEKGVAGLNVFLSLVAMMFMIGIIVMVFIIAGSKLRASVSTSTLNDTDAQDSINDTTQSIKTATDFFPTFIVLGSMVVLVLLTVIIINSIRQTGITGEGA